jgi:hypothetical protein
MEVEVFKTNVSDKHDALAIIRELTEIFPEGRVTFDLDDCDKILRVACRQVNRSEVITRVTGKGFDCCILE